MKQVKKLENIKVISHIDLCLEFLKSLRQDLAEALEKMENTKHIIDCDADPFVPEDWTVEEHKKMGKLEWNPKKIEFYLSEGQKDDKSIEGDKLRKELENKPVLNANVLDYLLAHKELIPEEWKKDNNGDIRYIFFWGTIYRGPDGDLFVRCLYFRDGQWRRSYYWFEGGWREGGWRDHDLAALLAK